MRQIDKTNESTAGRKPFIADDGIDLTKYTDQQTVVIPEQNKKYARDMLKNELKSQFKRHALFGLGAPATVLAGTLGIMATHNRVMHYFPDWDEVSIFVASGIAILIGGAVTLLNSPQTYCNTPYTNIIKHRHESLKIFFKNEQERTVRKLQTNLLAEADAVLAGGNLLDAKTISCLTAIEPELLHGASEQLAITVHQARQALSYARFVSGKSQDKSPLLPMTFKSQDLASDGEFGRKVLLERLHEAGTVIAEDKKTNSASLDIPLPENTLDNSRTNRLLRAIPVIGPVVFLVRDYFNLQAIDLPETKPVTINGLKPVADLVSSIETYETSPEGRQYPLDLPAMRGWQ